MTRSTSRRLPVRRDWNNETQFCDLSHIVGSLYAGIGRNVSAEHEIRQGRLPVRGDWKNVISDPRGGAVGSLYAGMDRSVVGRAMRSSGMYAGDG